MHLFGAGGVGNQGDQKKAGRNLDGLVDLNKVSRGPWTAARLRFLWIAVKVMHLWWQGRNMAVHCGDNAWKDGSAKLGDLVRSVDRHIGIDTKHVAQPAGVISVAM